MSRLSEPGARGWPGHGGFPGTGSCRSAAGPVAHVLDACSRSVFPGGNRGGRTPPAGSAGGRGIMAASHLRSGVQGLLAQLGARAPRPPGARREGGPAHAGGVTGGAGAAGAGAGAAADQCGNHLAAAGAAAGPGLPGVVHARGRAPGADLRAAPRPGDDGGLRQALRLDRRALHGAAGGAAPRDLRRRGERRAALREPRRLSGRHLPDELRGRARHGVHDGRRVRRQRPLRRALRLRPATPGRSIVATCRGWGPVYSSTVYGPQWACRVLTSATAAAARRTDE